MLMKFETFQRSSGHHFHRWSMIFGPFQPPGLISNGFLCFQHRPLKQSLQNLSSTRRFNKCWHQLFAFRGTVTHQNTSRELAKNLTKTTNNDRSSRNSSRHVAIPKTTSTTIDRNLQIRGAVVCVPHGA